MPSRASQRATNPMPVEARAAAQKALASSEKNLWVKRHVTQIASAQNSQFTRAMAGIIPKTGAKKEATNA